MSVEFTKFMTPHGLEELARFMRANNIVSYHVKDDYLFITRDYKGFHKKLRYQLSGKRFKDVYPWLIKCLTTYGIAWEQEFLETVLDILKDE
jgi:hypothetical protein